MNITFMIGNGFDLHLGMKTRFTDMYEGYIQSPSEDIVIQRFKEDLKESAGERYEKWSDFEIAMAAHAKDFTNENDFIKCVRSFKMYLGGYLKLEQDRFNTELQKLTREEICDEARKSVDSFYKFNTPNVTNAIDRIKSSSKSLSYSIINFNYTEVSDKIMKTAGCFYFDPIHIHGRLSGDIGLGIDNVDQFGSIPFVLSRKMNRAFIKPAFNKEFDENRAAKAASLIERSDVICVYGMSFGDSDLTWIMNLHEWIKKDKMHHLFYFGKQNAERGSAWVSDLLMDAEEERKRTILNKLSLEEELFEDQVHVPLTADIFDYQSLISKKKETSISEEKKAELLNRLNAALVESPIN